MKDFFKSVGAKVLLAIALFLVGIMIYAASTSGFSTIPSVVTGVIVTPVQTFFSHIAGGISDFFGQFSADEEQIEQLQKQIDALREKIIDYDDIKQQNEFYKDYLEIKKEHPDYQFADGRVIAVDPSDKYHNFTINAGSSRGIAPGNPVITSSGLVGVVTEVGPTFSKIRTILDPATQVSAFISSNYDSCITGGSVSLALDGLLRVELLPQNSATSVGDFVITSGIGGNYPASLPIGEIIDVSPASDGLSVNAVVRPFADIGNLRSVLVVTSFTSVSDGGR